MIKNSINSALQNKNAVMFITALVFMSGILGFFNDCEVLCAGILSLLAIIAVIKNYMPIKYIIFWIVVFYLGFFNSYFRIHLTDGLVPQANNKVSIKGQAVSIPNSSDNIKTKFFFKVYELNNKKVYGKTLVTVSDRDGDFSDFQIGDFYEMSGSLRTPFKAGNPSQFDYGKYLRNFDTFTVFYAQKSNCKPIDEKLSFKWQFLQNLNLLRDKIIKVHSQYLKSPNLEILG